MFVRRSSCRTRRPKDSRLGGRGNISTGPYIVVSCRKNVCSLRIHMDLCRTDKPSQIVPWSLRLQSMYRITQKK